MSAGMPNSIALQSARLELQAQESTLSDLDARIFSAERTLAELVAESQRSIEHMQEERKTLLERIDRTRAYVAPVRRLPDELLRLVFYHCFDDRVDVAWTLSAVSAHWRRLVLSMPMMWRKIHLSTTPQTSPDCIRLWLERSGRHVPLDIEITLQVTKGERQDAADRSNQARGRRSSPPLWAFPSVPGLLSSAPPPPPPLHGTVLTPPPLLTVPPPVWAQQGPPSAAHLSQSPAVAAQSSAYHSGNHWGHIAIYYLVQQMYRWERFVFRFEKQFASVAALKSINGDAPLLHEFEVSCLEHGYYADWPWLLSGTSEVLLPKLRSLTLQYAPFKWSSPVLRSNLTNLSIRSLPIVNLSLDRILNIVAGNPSLESLSLHFSNVLPHILPLSLTCLPALTDLNLGGHFLLSQLVDCLVLPALRALTLDIDTRAEPVEDTVTNLLSRSNATHALEYLSIAFDGPPTSMWYQPTGLISSWALLAELGSLRSLRVGSVPFESLFEVLTDASNLGAAGEIGGVGGGGGGGGGPSVGIDNGGGSVCAALTSLGLRNCHFAGDAVLKLVRMIEARNPTPAMAAAAAGSGSGIIGPARLKKVELSECANVGEDVIQWLNERVEEVVCTGSFGKPTGRYPFIHVP